MKKKKLKRIIFFCSSIVLNVNYGKNKHAHGLHTEWDEWSAIDE